VRTNFRVGLAEALPGAHRSARERVNRAPHEHEHSRRFHTYDDITTHRIDFTGCGTRALQEHLHEIHNMRRCSGNPDVESLSAAIDPFNRPIDLDCDRKGRLCRRSIRTWPFIGRPHTPSVRKHTTTCDILHGST
jgi:hypothetical protein